MAEKWIDRIKLRLAEAHFNRLVTTSEHELRPGLSAGIVLSVALSLLILAVPPMIAALGIWLILWSGFAIIATIVGLVLVGMAWTTLPSVDRLGTEPLGRSDVPALFRLVDALAENMGAPRVDGLHIAPHYNAFIGRFGLRRRRILGIGLALWQVLEPEERVSVLAHELAHEISGDPARLLIVSGARHSLSSWIKMLVPDQRFVDVSPIGDNAGLPLARQFMLMAAWLLTFCLRGHRILDMRQSQQAEYFADLLAARAAGTAAARRLLEKLVLYPYVRSLIVHKPGRVQNAGHALLSGLNGAVRAIPADQRARLFDRMEEEKISIDASHPPTVYRLLFLSHHAKLAGTFDAASVDWDEIAAELEPYLEAHGQALLEDPDLL